MHFDEKYTLPISQMMNGNFNIIGFISSRIDYDNDTETWTLKLASDSNKHAITHGKSLPFGTKQYVMSQSLGGGNILLHLNACNDREQFNCRDGSCIPIENRCNSEYDCQDGDDESDCNLIGIPQSYLNFVPGKMLTTFKLHLL